MQRAQAVVLIALLGLMGCAPDAEQVSEEEVSSPPSPSISESPLLEDRIEAEITVADEPDWMAVGYGSLWVTRDEAGAVDRIDPSTNEVLETIAVGGHPCTGAASGFGSIWVPSCSENAVYRIDARSQKVVSVIETPIFQTYKGTGPFGGIAAGKGAVWMVTKGNSAAFDSLVRIDPETNKLAKGIDLGFQAGAVEVTEGAIWVLAPGDDRLLRVDPERGQVVAEVEGLAQPSYIAATEDALWIISGTWSDNPGGDGSVTRVDPLTNEIVARIQLDEIPGNVSDIAAGSGYVWARSARTVARIDSQKNEIVERFDANIGGGAMEIGFGSLWLSDYVNHRVWQIEL